MEQADTRMPAPVRAGPGLRVDGLTRRFGRVAALEDVSLHVHPGELVAVVGENGAGKSTLVRCIAGELAPDAGTVTIDGAPGPQLDPGRWPARGSRPRPASLAVVWQDLGLCGDLDVVANVFLGRELGTGLLAEAQMVDATRAALEAIGARVPDLRAEVASLSRGQQQEVALARAMVGGADVLVLDEPTAALSAPRRVRVQSTLRRRRDEGAAILLITHDLDEVFALADRIVVLRRGAAVATVTPSAAHPDDVAALLSGVEIESVARQQLDRIRSLVAQLSAAGPAASLPLVVSTTALALDQGSLCVHLLEPEGPQPTLRLSASVGLADALADALATLPLDERGATIGDAARVGALQVCEDLEVDGVWTAHRAAVVAAGVRSVWSAPITGSGGVLGTLTGFSATPGRLTGDQVELVSLYAGHAAAAIEREHLLDEVRRRNRVLESLRGMLESLAGPDRVDAGPGVALLALCRGLGAVAVALVSVEDDDLRWSGLSLDGSITEDLRSHVDASLAAVEPTQVAPGIAGVRVPVADGASALLARFADPTQPDDEARALLDDAARSLALAIQREHLEVAKREAATAVRSQALQRDLLERLSHELRTPLTAIHGYASTMQQPDLTWDEASTTRFLDAIVRESGRMERLVGDLLDSSAIESGAMQLRRDWTELPLVLEAARACVRDPSRIEVVVAGGLEPIWADHDRLEQVFVNLFDNAVRHGGGHVVVEAGCGRDGTVEVTVRDDGPGVPDELLDSLFTARVHADGSGGVGLGLAIARGIAEAHGGSCTLLPGPPTAFRVVLPVEPADEVQELARG